MLYAVVEHCYSLPARYSGSTFNVQQLYSNISPTVSTTMESSGITYSSAALQPKEVLYPYGCDPQSTESLLFTLSSSQLTSVSMFTDKLESMLVDVGQQLEQLTRAQQNIRRSLDYHRALITPIRRVPTDILIDIFKCCLELEYDSLPQAAERYITPFHARSVSCILSYVCRRWRSLLLGTPLLWPRRLAIHLPGEKRRRLPPKGVFELLELYLERSKPMALHISLSCHRPLMQFLNTKEEARIYWEWGPSDMCCTIFEHSERIRTLQVCMGSRNAVPDDPLPGVIIPFPQLESLFMPDSKRLPSWLEKALKAAPKLRYLHAGYNNLKKIEEAEYSPKTALPFIRQITTLTLGNHHCRDPVGYEDALATLALVPKLEECTLYTCKTSHPSLPPMTMQQLKAFHWEDSSSDDSSEDGSEEDDNTDPPDSIFLSQFILPSLEDLKMITGIRPPRVQQFLRDSRCTITSFTFQLEGGLQSDVNHMVTLLEELTSLESLEIISKTMPHHLLQGFIAEAGLGVPLCPRLQHLRFTAGDAASDKSWDAELALVTDVIRTRSHFESIDTARKLSRLGLHFHVSELPTFSPDSIKDLGNACLLGGCIVTIMAEQWLPSYLRPREFFTFCMDTSQWVDAEEDSAWGAMV